MVKPRNGLHTAVVNGLNQEGQMPILRALGLIDKYLTGPWMLWQGEAHTILETSDIFTSVIDKITQADSTSLIHGFDETAFSTSGKKDDKSRKLIESTQYDDTTAEILKLILDEAKKVMERQLVDYLPRGQFHNPSEQLVTKAASCNSNNISGERVFAMWDARSNQSKTASINKVSSKTTFKANKVHQRFLDGKTEEEKAAIISQATKEGGRDRRTRKEKAPCWME